MVTSKNRNKLYHIGSSRGDPFDLIRILNARELLRNHDGWRNHIQAQIQTMSAKLQKSSKRVVKGKKGFTLYYICIILIKKGGTNVRLLQKDNIFKNERKRHVFSKQDKKLLGR